MGDWQRTHTIIILLLGLLFVDTSLAQIFEFESIIRPESSITIEGSSNVAKIACHYEDPFPNDTLYHSSILNNTSFTVSGDSLNLTVNLFDCGKRAINRDMRKTLKQSEFPEITAWIDTISIEDEFSPSASISVAITDVVQNYNIPLEAVEEKETITRISGAQEIRLSDFGLKAPTALFGMVKVSDIFQVKFDLHIGKKKGS